MPFATTQRLILRAYRESDKDSFMELGNDQRVMRTASPYYTVPQGPNYWKTTQEDFLDKALFVAVVEVKKDYAHLRKWDSEEKRKEDALKQREDWDRELFVGQAALTLPVPKNRDVWLGIQVAPQWWGNGFATEVVEWLVEHSFEQLGLHRVSLRLFGHNVAAKRVYDKCGFVEEGRKRKAGWIEGQWIDEIYMGILENEYWERKKQLANSS